MPEAKRQPKAPDAGDQPAPGQAAKRQPLAPGGESGQRAAWGSISRSQIVDAAIASIRAGGEEHLTIRGLAADLGVAPMSLYHHVRSRDDLLDEVVGVLLGEVWRPESPEPKAPGAARAWLAEAADRFRRFLVEHAVALHVYLRHPVVSETAIARMEAMLRALASAGLTGEGAHRAYGALHTYTVGFAALEASRRRGATPAEEQGVGEEQSGARRSQDGLRADDDEHSGDGQPAGKQEAGERPAVGLADRLAAYTTHEQFLAGLDFLLDGVIGRASGGSRAVSGSGRDGETA